MENLLEWNTLLHVHPYRKLTGAFVGEGLREKELGSSLSPSKMTTFFPVSPLISSIAAVCHVCIYRVSNVDQNWGQSYEFQVCHCGVAMQKSDLYLDLIQIRIENSIWFVLFPHESHVSWSDWDPGHPHAVQGGLSNVPPVPPAWSLGGIQTKQDGGGEMVTERVTERSESIPPQTLASHEEKRGGDRNWTPEAAHTPRRKNWKPKKNGRSSKTRLLRGSNGPGIGEGTKGFPCRVWIGTVALLSTQQRVGSKGLVCVGVYLLNATAVNAF